MTLQTDALFSALADPTRRAIFERLCRNGEQTVHALTGAGDISQPAVSKHLRILKDAGLVRDRRQGRETHYTAKLKGLAPLTKWISLYSEFWHKKFDRLEDLLQRMDQ